MSPRRRRKHKAPVAALWTAAVLFMGVFASWPESWGRPDGAGPSEHVGYASGNPWHLSIWTTRDGRVARVRCYDLGRVVSPASEQGGEGSPAMEGPPLLFAQQVPTRLPARRGPILLPPTRPRPVGGLSWDESRQALVAVSGQAVTYWILEEGEPLRAVHTSLDARADGDGARGIGLRAPVVFPRAEEEPAMYVPECPGCREDLGRKQHGTPAPVPVVGAPPADFAPDASGH